MIFQSALTCVRGFGPYETDDLSSRCAKALHWKKLRHNAKVHHDYLLGNQGLHLDTYLGSKDMRIASGYHPWSEWCQLT
jgi:hypothetical protein